MRFYFTFLLPGGRGGKELNGDYRGFVIEISPHYRNANFTKERGQKILAMAGTFQKIVNELIGTCVIQG